VGEAVKEVQQALGIQADGFFGPKTEQAVKDFQTGHSLDVDGIVGPRTRAQLLEKRAQENATEEKKPSPTPEQKPTPIPEQKKDSTPAPESGGRWWARGSWGDAVKEIQQALGVQADGFFGPKTEQAVKEFQVLHNLIVDGIVGPRTRAAMEPSAPASSGAQDQLASMGFSDPALNARLLEKHKGDVDQVIAEMLGA
jgi:peptidoglycan hydrolase-like protein with peptidoglycan-binding domain